MISPDTIALVRERTDLVALVREHVPSLKQRGRSFVGLCPFHKEKTGSFHVNPDRGFFHCFGCKESGTAIDFVMKQEGATFPEAIRSLAERAGIAIEEERVERGEVDRLKKQRDALFTACQVAATFYERQLREHPNRALAIGELARRGLVPSWAVEDATEAPEAARQAAIDDALQAFRIGYAPPAWDGLAGYLKQQGVSPAAAESAGLLVPRSSGSGHYDRFRHRLMFAVLDTHGKVIAFSGRALPPLPGESPEDKPAKYINSPESPIYAKGHTLFGIYQARHAIRQAGTAVLVEGNFDVVSLHAHGVQNAVAPLGTAFTLDQAKLLQRFAHDAVLLFDADLAGKKAVKLARRTVKEAKLTAKVASLPSGTDPDEYVRTKGAGALQKVVAGAMGMLEFLLEDALDESFAQADAFERAQRVAAVNKLLAEEDDPLVRSMGKTYADRLAGRLDLVQSGDAFRALERSVTTALAKANAEQPHRGPSREEARVHRKKPGSMERGEIVGALIEFPSLLSDPSVQEALDLLEGESARTVVTLRSAWAHEASDVPQPGEQSHDFRDKSLDTTAFLAQIPPAIRAFAIERLAAPRHATREEALAHLLENARKLRNVILERETAAIAQENYKTKGDWEADAARLREADRMARTRAGVSKGSAASADEQHEQHEQHGDEGGRDGEEG